MRLVIDGQTNTMQAWQAVHEYLEHRRQSIVQEFEKILLLAKPDPVSQVSGVHAFSTWLAVVGIIGRSATEILQARYPELVLAEFVMIVSLALLLYAMNTYLLRSGKGTTQSENVASAQ